MIQIDNGNHIITLTIQDHENRNPNAHIEPVLSTSIDIITPTISTDYLTYIHLDEIEQFYEHLKQLQTTTQKKIPLITFETGIEIEAIHDLEGSIHWDIKCINPDSDGGMHTICFQNNHDELKKIRTELENILELYTAK